MRSEVVKYCILVVLLIGGAVLFSACEGGPERVEVQSGAVALAENGFDALSGERVGLIVNHTARVDTAHLIDRIDAAPNVELGAIFAPEHGLRGTSGAGEAVVSGRDPRTGTPIYSLYGETRKPTAEMLEGLDALVFDVQDVGARFYTYITTMGLAMQAAAESDVRFVVLDRPNPLGGSYTSGFVLEPEHESFVGRYPVPITHGMTIGELARYIRGEALLPGLESLDLTVRSMSGWNREMQWPDTGREWVPPSPNLPTWKTALVYPGMCFFEGVRVSEGRGTQRPFLQIGAPWSAEAARDVVGQLRSHDLSGVDFDTTSFIPQPMPNAAPYPRFEGTRVYGFELSVTDRQAVRPVAVGIHALHAMYQQAREEGVDEFISRPEHLTRLAGTERLAQMLRAEVSPDSIVASWAREVQDFRHRRSAYFLY